ncbi:MAG: KpsF/GutQ family sugar-phosphate isomerase, partial [Kaistella sp.]|nr:KpsF/GutQ family sugar-phosphate isomerase [Kaistella sp.]
MNQPEILQIAKNAISIEIKELENLKNRLDDNFLKATELINSAAGKLIIVGIGKSAHVGNKIVATLNSTGTPSQFLHASEAIHGDLGVIQKTDVVLCISNSGNSPEIVNLLPFLKDYSSALIGMTGNLNSKLAEFSDVILNSSVEKEACPIKLAPTSSTTVQMALGDALAVCLMELNGFKENDFAKFHPGGSLGKNLTAKVEQFLSSQKPQVSENANIREIIISVSGSSHGITVVTDGEAITGVITDGDLRRMLLS